MIFHSGIPQRVERFSREIFQWFLEFRVAILFTCVLTLVVVWKPFFLEKIWVTWSVVALNLAGVVLTINGLLSLRKYFGLPSMEAILHDWWSRKPVWRRDVSIAAECRTATTGSASLSTMRIEASPTATMDEQVAWLLKEVKSLSENQTTIERALQTVEERQKQDAAALSERAAAMETAWKSQLIHLHTSGITETLCGLGWIISATMLGALYS